MRTYISGSRRLSNIFWALAVTMGGLGFFLTGLSSYFTVNLLIFSDLTNIAFIPQGIILTFYGTVGLILGIFLCLTIWWDVGFGYNDYNAEQITIYRKGFPGKNRELSLIFPSNIVKSIKVKVKDGLNPRRQLFLCLKDRREIPLTGIDQPVELTKVENEAVSLAKYLNVFLETE
jgi:hypothetical protein|mmetsp:Transcript_21741/g.70214  ORF Transcript_21741/g.70214 Transcript_21741/m.70214 type:complete len:175 (-) Transcript_21741:193-717(-)